MFFPLPLFCTYCQGLGYLQNGNILLSFSPEWATFFMNRMVEFKNFLNEWRSYCNEQENKCMLVLFSNLAGDSHGTMKNVLLYLDIPQNRLDCLNYTSIIEGKWHRNKKSKKSMNEEDSPFCQLSPKVQREARSFIERYVNSKLQVSSDNFDVLLAKAIKNEWAVDTRNATCSKFLFEPI